MHPPEPATSMIAVMTCRDPRLIQEVLAGASALGESRSDPEGALNHWLAEGVAFLVAFADARAVGFLAYRWTEGALRIDHVAVRDDHRRVGVARRLMQAIEAIGSALGTRNLSFELPPECRATFERYGYERSEAAPGDRVMMIKSLL